jgi:hypothetical protein
VKLIRFVIPTCPEGAPTHTLPYFLLLLRMVPNAFLPIDLILPTLGLTQPPAKMSARNLPGGKARLARKDDNLTAICEPTVKKCEILDVSQPYRSLRPVKG